MSTTFQNLRVVKIAALLLVFKTVIKHFDPLDATLVTDAKEN